MGGACAQVDIAERGFSVMRDGPIDMRMDPDAALSAEEVRVWGGWVGWGSAGGENEGVRGGWVGRWGGCQEGGWGRAGALSFSPLPQPLPLS
jgi:hypothetical protein